MDDLIFHSTHMICYGKTHILLPSSPYSWGTYIAKPNCAVFLWNCKKWLPDATQLQQFDAITATSPCLLADWKPSLKMQTVSFRIRFVPTLCSESRGVGEINIATHLLPLLTSVHSTKALPWNNAPNKHTYFMPMQSQILSVVLRVSFCQTLF